jgi:hypothetical protein
LLITATDSSPVCRIDQGRCLLDDSVHFIDV